MFCPECKAEYRPGFTHCVDCDVDLVDALPSEQAKGLAQPLQLVDPSVIWIGDSESDCVVQCQMLKKANIPYDVAQQVKERRGGMGVTWRYELGVSATDEQRAKDLLELPEKVVEWNSETPEEDENQALLEYPEGLSSDEDEARRRRDYLKAFYPEDASVDIGQVRCEGDSGIELALKENYIRVRVQPQADGSKKLFVLPEDEAAAREIVGEIDGDSPHS